MEKLLYFNIGFRCENICEALNNYNKTGFIDEEILLDSKRLVSDSFKINEKFVDSLASSRYESYEFYPIIFESFKGKTLKEIVDSLNIINDVLQNISKKSNINIKPAYDFFSKVATICIEKSSIQDDLALSKIF